MKIVSPPAVKNQWSKQLGKIDELRIVKYGVGQKMRNLPLEELNNICPDTLYLYCWGGGGDWGCHPVKPVPPPAGHKWADHRGGVLRCSKCNQMAAMFNDSKITDLTWGTYWKLYGKDERDDPSERPDVIPCDAVAMDEALK